MSSGHRLRLALFLTSALLAGPTFASTSAVTPEQGAPAPQAASSPTAAPHAATASSPAAAERYAIQALIEKQHYLEAFEKAVRLRDQEPRSVETNVLLARACHGLGRFEEAISTYVEALKLDPKIDNPTLLLLLHASGHGREILSALADQGTVDINVLARLEEGLDELDPPLAAPAAPAQKPIKLDISDTYHLKMKIGGKTARVLFTTGFGGLVVSDDFAQRTGLDVKSGTLEIPEFRLGDVTLHRVSAHVVKDLDRTNSAQGLDGMVGMGIFPGYAFRVDRRKGTLELYPPGLEPPVPTEKATVQRYFLFGPYAVTDVVIRNRSESQPAATGFKGKMIVNTGFQATTFDIFSARLYDFGQIDSTTTVTMMTSQSYEKTVAVRMSAIHFAGGVFEFDQFLAADQGDYAGFRPFGTLGRDLLHEFIVTVDPRKHTIALEMYR